MQEKLSLLRCNVCGNIAQIVVTGYGKPVCCEKEMEILQENEVNSDNAHYAHVEKISENERKISFNHEMTKDHWIELVEIISNDKKYIKRKYFDIGEKPEITIKCDCKEGYYVRTYCNIHGVCTTKNIKEEN